MENPSGSSSGIMFDFKELCFICAKKLDRKHKKVITVPNDYQSKERLIKLCEKNCDSESLLVSARIQSVPSLVEAKAAYHKLCYDRLLQVLYPTKARKRDDGYEAALQKVFHYIIESDKHQFTLLELQNLLQEYFRSNEVLFTALKKKFGTEISIIQGRGTLPKIFYKKADIAEICTDWHYAEDQVSDGAKKTILKVAAEILKTEIKSNQYDHTFYPYSNNFLDNVRDDVPPLLSFFLDDFLFDDNDNHSKENFIKRDSIAHSIISVIRPKSFISCLQLAVGTYIHRKTGSKLIIQLLSKLGVSATYDGIQLYEASTIMDPAKFVAEDTFIQFVFDNTDHNVSTLDGRETFHCLGGIGVYTPGCNVSYQGSTQTHQSGIKKLKKMPSASTLAKQKQIRTIPHSAEYKPALDTIKYVATSSMDLSSPPLLQQHYSAYLWAKYLQLPQIPSWKGFMDRISNDIEYTMSHVICLPFINELPSNLTTINTSLNYALEETAKLNQRTCFVTFDQPLYLKARSITAQMNNTKYKNVVVRLGGFHLLISYLGAIGHIMEGSGLEDLWSVIYASESIKKMMSGHAFSRSVRAHILTFTALGILICAKINAEKESTKNDNPQTQQSYQEYEGSKNGIKLLFENWSTNPPQLHQLDINLNIQHLTGEFTEYLDKVSCSNPTAQLWVQYFKAVSVALQYIESERLGNWALHLQCVKCMLPLFHAAGHFAYAKSAQIYLQDMLNLEITMDPKEYDLFTKEGYFTIRRSDKAWSGIWSDMTIEQTLNRFFGTDLKHGRGVTPSVVARYLLGMPAAFHIMEKLEEVLNMRSCNSEQHTDLSQSRRTRDESDITKLLIWLHEHRPFEPRTCLLSLSTGIIGNKEINCHKAYEIGNDGMQTMIDRSAEFSLKQLYKVRNLLQAKLIHVDGKYITIDPLMLFQRISVTLQGNENKMREAFEYELSPYPLSLFDEQGLMRKSNKAQLFKIFKPFIQTDALLDNSTIVIDGGWLLHHVIWPHSRTFGEIFDLYHRFIIKRYGSKVTVVFDGYDNIGVKSYERYRRKERTLAADVCISEDNLIRITQAKFLSNTVNKLKFVEKLNTFLLNKNIKTKIAAEDADALIVTTALELSEASPSPVVIIGNDVDLLILLVALAPENQTYYYYKISSGKVKYVLYSTRDQKELKSLILFAHAFAGCDSTSAFYNKGKKTIIKVLQTNLELQREIEVFYRPNSSLQALCAVAEKIVLNLYQNKKVKTLMSMKHLRYEYFRKCVLLAKKEITIASLPPTESVLKEHVKRVYYQIQLWIGNNLNPEQWGWERTQMMLIPVLNPKEPAPKDLLNLVHCSCTTDCSTVRCSCKKSGLKCTHLCRQCNGETCSNRQTLSTGREQVNEDSDDEDERQNITEREEIGEEASEEEEEYVGDEIDDEENKYDNEEGSTSAFIAD